MVALLFPSIDPNTVDSGIVFGDLAASRCAADRAGLAAPGWRCWPGALHFGTAVIPAQHYQF